MASVSSSLPSFVWFPNTSFIDYLYRKYPGEVPTVKKKRKPSPSFWDLDDDLHSWILAERKKGLGVLNFQVKQKALELAAQKGYTMFKASHGWIAEFKRRKNLIYRCPTKTARKETFTDEDLVSKTAIGFIYSFLYSEWLQREEEAFLDRIKKIKVVDFIPHDRIYNLDQTMVRLVSPHAKTIATKGEKQVRLSDEALRTFRDVETVTVWFKCFTDLQVLVKHPPGDKEGFTITLTIRADGGKHPAVIVFKGGRSGELSEKIMKSLEVPRNIFVHSSASAWWTEPLDHLWVKYTFPDGDAKKILFRDQAPVQRLVSTQLLLDDRNVEQTFIPAARTGDYQPLDVGVNRPFKVYYREESAKWRSTHFDTTKSNYLKKPSRQDFINMVSTAWSRVSEECVRKAFKEIIARLLTTWWLI